MDGIITFTELLCHQTHLQSQLSKTASLNGFCQTTLKSFWEQRSVVDACNCAQLCTNHNQIIG